MNTLFAFAFLFSLICAPIFVIWALIKRLQKKPAKKPLGKALVSAIVFVVSFIGFSATMEPVIKAESIELSIPDYQSEYDINTEIPVEISIIPEDADTRALEYITDSETLTFSESAINTGSEEGTYKISIESGNVKSNTVTVSVVDIAAREAEQKADEQRIAEEKRLAEEQLIEAEKAAKEAEERRLAEEKAAQEAKERRLAEEKAAEEAEEKRLAEEKAAQEAEERRLAEEKAAQEAEERRLAEEKAAQEEQIRQEASISSGSTSQNNTSRSGGSGNAENFNTYDNVEQQQTSDDFVLNTSTHKIHYPSCRDVPKIKPQNYSTSNQSVSELEAQGYTTCGHCFK